MACGKIRMTPKGAYFLDCKCQIDLNEVDQGVQDFKLSFYVPYQLRPPKGETVVMNVVSDERPNTEVQTKGGARVITTSDQPVRGRCEWLESPLSVAAADKIFSDAVSQLVVSGCKAALARTLSRLPESPRVGQHLVSSTARVKAGTQDIYTVTFRPEDEGVAAPTAEELEQMARSYLTSEGVNIKNVAYIDCQSLACSFVEG